MREIERTGKPWVMNPRILIIAGLLLLCLVPAGVQAAVSADSYVNVSIQKTISISIEDPFTGTWALNVGPNTQDYGNLSIVTNAQWTLYTTATYGDYLRRSSTTPLSSPLLLNSGLVTAFIDTGPSSKKDDLSFSQQVAIDDLVDYYETTVTFTAYNT
jgi:hypothetical protein